MKANWILLAALSVALAPFGARATSLQASPSAAISLGLSSFSVILSAALPPSPQQEEVDDETIPSEAATPPDSAPEEVEHESEEAASPDTHRPVERPQSEPGPRGNASPAERSARTTPGESRTRGTTRQGAPTSSNRRVRGSALSRREGGSPRRVGRSFERAASGQGRDPSGNVGDTNYAAFRLITERNIFDTTRSPRSSRQRVESRQTPPSESITLVGILSYEKGSYAFFDGSASRYRKVLRTGEAIAGYKITDMTADTVRLQSGTNKVELLIGMQLRKGEEGWQLAGGRPVSAKSSPTAVASVESSADEDEIVKRLMRQREQELK